MINLSDTQAILLASAAQRTNGSVLPLPGSIKPGGGASKAIGVILKYKLAEERQTTDTTAVHRRDGDLSFGIFITDAGMATIGVDQAAPASEAETARSPATAVVAKAPSKIATMLEMLTREDGTPVSAIIEATGWLPHTIRAAITGLRKKGHDIERIKRDDATCYRLLVAA